MLFGAQGQKFVDPAIGPSWKFLQGVLEPGERLDAIEARGAEQARTLGVPVDRVRRVVYFVASLATATSVTQAGAIGFVGLIVPHLVRLIVGNDQRLLLPSAVLAGGSLLVVADTLARTVVAPQQLPVGVLTALIGVPVFLFLLLRETRPGR